MFKTLKNKLTGPVGPMGEHGRPGEMPRYRAPKFELTPNAPKGHPLPARAREGDAGYDLMATGTRDTVLYPGERRTLSTGVSVRLDPSTVGLILPRSGNSSKRGLAVFTGVVDAGYTGELKVTVRNTTSKKLVLAHDARIAQLVTVPVVTGGGTVLSGERGAHGFGSTDTEPWQRDVLTKALDNSDSAIYPKYPLVKDMVNHPPHYSAHPIFSGECHAYTKYMTFNQGNAFKYLWRCAAKGDIVENLRKAAWYLKAMRDGPLLDRYGNTLDLELVNRLERELAPFVETPLNEHPAKFAVALEGYSAATLIAAKDIPGALDLVNDAIRRATTGLPVYPKATT